MGGITYITRKIPNIFLSYDLAMERLVYCQAAVKSTTTDDSGGEGCGFVVVRYRNIESLRIQ